MSRWILAGVLLVLVPGCVSKTELEAERARANQLEQELAKTRAELKAAQAELAAIEEKRNAVPDPDDFEGWAALVVPQLSSLVRRVSELQDSELPGRACAQFDDDVRALKIPETQSRLLGSSVTEMRRHLSRAAIACQGGDTMSFSFNGLEALGTALKVNQVLANLGVDAEIGR